MRCTLPCPALPCQPTHSPPPRTHLPARNVLLSAWPALQLPPGRPISEALDYELQDLKRKMQG